MKSFGNIKIGDYIVRVKGYKCESARVISIGKSGNNELTFIVEGTETKKEYVFDALRDSCWFGLVSEEKYYADDSMLPGLREGIMIGFEYARLMIIKDFTPVTPRFMVGDEPEGDNEKMYEIIEKIEMD